MVIVHRIFRRELRLATGLVRAVALGDRPRATHLARYLTFVLDTLHHHHSGEDDLLWPKLLARTTPDTQLIHRMQGQHEQMATAVQAIEHVIPQWTRLADTTSRDRLADAIERLYAQLSAHLDEEEEHLLPLVARHLTIAEWAQVGQRGLAGTPRSKRMILLGAILEDASTEEATAFLAKIPAVARLAYRLVGQRQYAQWAARVRGKA